MDQFIINFNKFKYTVPLASLDEKELIRCQRCKAYLNPFMQFVDGGRNFLCNLCGLKNAVPDYYFSNLGVNGKRLDHHLRPELQFGTMDFRAPPVFIFYLFILSLLLFFLKLGYQTFFFQFQFLTY